MKALFFGFLESLPAVQDAVDLIALGFQAVAESPDQPRLVFD